MQATFLGYVGLPCFARDLLVTSGCSIDLEIPSVVCTMHLAEEARVSGHGARLSPPVPPRLCSPGMYVISLNRQQWLVVKIGARVCSQRMAQQQGQEAHCDKGLTLQAPPDPPVYVAAATHGSCVRRRQMPQDGRQAEAWRASNDSAYRSQTELQLTASRTGASRACLVASSNGLRGAFEGNPRHQLAQDRMANKRRLSPETHGQPTSTGRQGDEPIPLTPGPRSEPTARLDTQQTDPKHGCSLQHQTQARACTTGTGIKCHAMV
jgi:hypothetical protein